MSKVFGVALFFMGLLILALVMTHRFAAFMAALTAPSLLKAV